MQNSGFRINLGKNSADGILRAVGLHYCQISKIVVGQYRSGGESLFECVKGFLTRFRPSKGRSLFGELVERAGEVRVAHDETSVKISKSQKGLNFFNGSGNRPISYGRQFSRVHGEAGRRDDDT